MREHSDYVHLHVHTDYSLLDGANKIGDLVKAARKFRMPALAITDHGNLFGAIEFYEKAIKGGIKPILGSEVYVAIGSRKERGSSSGSDLQTATANRNWGGARGVGYHHLTLLVRNDLGYQNLMHLSTIGYLEGFYYKPRIDKEVLEKHSEGLLALSGCLQSEISQALLAGDGKKAREAAGFYGDLFGRGNFYLELMRIGLEENLKVNEGLLKISKELDLPLVATNDCHYLQREDAKAHDILLCLQTGKDLEDKNRLRFNTQELYFKSPEEMKSLFHDLPEAILSTREIAEVCNLELNLVGAQGRSPLCLPHYPLPEGYEKPEEYFEELARKGIARRYGKVTPAVEERLDFELKTIEKVGYAEYFLIIKDLVDTARSRGIPVGPGRGSAVGSLALYALGITDIDPLEYGLLFERFLNPARISPPDVDIDFGDERRDEIIEYTIEKYGKDAVSQIITFGTMMARAVIRDVGRVLKIPYGEVDRIAKLIPFGPNVTLEGAVTQSQELKELIHKEEKTRELFEIAKRLEGLSRHASTHAAGVVIAPGRLADYCPLFKGTHEEISTQYSMKSIEAIGLLKMDLLGLKTLTVIDNTINMLKEKGVRVDLSRIPKDDPKTFELISRGETLGVFQLESAGMREILKRLEPRSMEDLIAVLSLYRPGPLKGLNVSEFIERRHGRKPIQYDHPVLEPILKETYGVILYQEQVIEIASRVAGYILGHGDILRRAMGKKEPEVMEEERKNFVEGAKKNGFSEKLAHHIFDQMLPFAGYGFNKSHSAGYAMVSYETAYLKAHHPLEFMAASLTSEMDSSDRISLLLSECKRMRIDVRKPDINESFYEFRVLPKNSERGNAIGSFSFGLGAVKNTGRGTIESILSEREKNGPYESLYDFAMRVLQFHGGVNRRAVESLIEAGAFDSISKSRRESFSSLTKAYEKGTKTGRVEVERKKQMTLFGGLVVEPEKGVTEEVETGLKPVSTKEEEWEISEKLNREKKSLGFYLSGHPLEPFREVFQGTSIVATHQLDKVESRNSVTIGGMVTRKKQIRDRKGREMAFITIEDFEGEAEAVVFADLYEESKALLRKEVPILVKGRKGEEEKKVIAEEIHPLEKVKRGAEVPSANSERRVGKIVEIFLHPEHEPLLLPVKDLLLRYPGAIPVEVHLLLKEGKKVLHPKMRVSPLDSFLKELGGLIGKENIRI